MKHICILTATLFAVSGLHAQSVVLPNGDFEAGVQHFPNGFDANPDIPGWFDLAPITDSGVEGPGAWWGTYQGHSAFMAAGDGAYNLSDYTIQSGDEYLVSFVAKSWNNGSSEWTVSLFYDEPTNVIGTFSTPTDGIWTEYSNSLVIVATAESVGGILGVSFLNSGGFFANLDNVAITVIPEPSTVSMVLALCCAGLFLQRRRKS